jgi:hypothetical protein
MVCGRGFSRDISAWLLTGLCRPGLSARDAKPPWARLPVFPQLWKPLAVHTFLQETRYGFDCCRDGQWPQFNILILTNRGRFHGVPSFFQTLEITD